MKRLLIATAFIALALAFSLPASAQVYCGSYPDTNAGYDDTTTFCWQRGYLCYNCADVFTGANCSSNGAPCDPYAGQHGPVFNRVCVPNPPAPTQAASRSRKDRLSTLKTEQIL